MTTQTQRQVEATLKFGQFLTITAETQRGLVVTTYFVKFTGVARVDLVTWDEAKRAEGEVYTVTRFTCTCPAWTKRGRKTLTPCKHRIALGLPHIALLPPAILEPQRKDHAPDHDEEQRAAD